MGVWCAPGISHLCSVARSQYHRRQLRMRTHKALVTLVATLAITAAEDITVTTTKGRLRGERVDADMGQYYYAFKGVPYAKSPTKDLRFQV